MRRIVEWGLVLALASSPAAADQQATLRGRLSVDVEGLVLGDAGAIVVYLEPDEKQSEADDIDRPPVQVRQTGARFEPPFVAVAIGQVVEMPNDDIIYHNVFSYSKPNDFDLGLYAAGASRTLKFDSPGLVRIYCSIHEAMDGLIFVSPTRHFDVPDSDGQYELRDLPAGRFRLHVWSERLPEFVRSVELSPSDLTQLDLELGRGAN